MRFVKTYFHLKRFIHNIFTSHAVNFNVERRQKQRARLKTFVGSLCCLKFLTCLQSADCVSNHVFCDYVSQALRAFGHLQNLKPS